MVLNSRLTIDVNLSIFVLIQNFRGTYNIIFIDYRGQITSNAKFGVSFEFDPRC